MLLNQFSEAALIIIEFLEPVPAEQCTECDPDWLGWYCYNCHHTIRGFPQWYRFQPAEMASEKPAVAHSLAHVKTEMNENPAEMASENPAELSG